MQRQNIKEHTNDAIESDERRCPQFHAVFSNQTGSSRAALDSQQVVETPVHQVVRPAVHQPYTTPLYVLALTET